MVAEIDVFNHRDPENPMRVPIFFDTGSQPSFITLELAAILGPPRVAKDEMQVGGFMSQSVRLISPRYSVLLKRYDGGWEPVTLNQTPSIVPPVEFLINDEVNEEGVCPQSATPQILLGIRDFWRFVVNCEEIQGGLFRIETVFGAAYGGELPDTKSTLQQFSCPLTVRYPLHTPNETGYENVQILVRQMWDLQTLGIRDEELGHETAAVDAFNESIEFREGRYFVDWPWKPGCPTIMDNFNLSYSRLKSLLNRLKSDSKLRESYGDNLKELLNKGIIEPTTRVGYDEYFMPHHPVITEKKVRMVHDASAHSKGCFSLNECLLPGPKLGPDLAAILLRFRCSPVPIWRFGEGLPPSGIKGEKPGNG